MDLPALRTTDVSTGRTTRQTMGHGLRSADHNKQSLFTNRTVISVKYSTGDIKPSPQKRGLYAMAMFSLSVRLSVARELIFEVIRYVAAPGGERRLIVSIVILVCQASSRHTTIQKQLQ